MDFAIKAPANVKLFGEHAVIYGKKCLAAAVSLFATAQVTAAEDPDHVKITLEDYGQLNQRFSAKILKEVHIKFRARNLEPRSGIETYSRYLAEKLGVNEHIAPLLTVVSEIYQLNQNSVAGSSVRIHSDVPIRQGWGSSNVCIAALAGGLARYERLKRDQMIDLVVNGERVAHKSEGAGRIDSGPSVLGGVVSYSRKYGYEKIDVNLPLNLLAVNTGPKPPTSETVAAVAERYRTKKEETERALDEIEQCTNGGILALKNKDVKKLGGFMTKNQELLDELGVASSKVNPNGIREAVKIAIDHGAYGAKLSGGGGGGLAVVLCDVENNGRISRQLKDAGFSVEKLRTVNEGVMSQMKS